MIHFISVSPRFSTGWESQHANAKLFSMRRFTYKTISLGRQDWEDELDRLAAQGYRLVCGVGESAASYPNGALLLEKLAD